MDFLSVFMHFYEGLDAFERFLVTSDLFRPFFEPFFDPIWRHRGAFLDHFLDQNRTILGCGVYNPG